MFSILVCLFLADLELAYVDQAGLELTVTSLPLPPYPKC